MNFKRYFYLVSNRSGGYIKKLYQARRSHGLFSSFLIAALGFNSTVALGQPELLASVTDTAPSVAEVSLPDPETLCSMREMLFGTGIEAFDTQYSFNKEQCLEAERKRQEMLSPQPDAEAAKQALEEQQFQATVTQLTELTEGYPIAQMAETIAVQDPEIAALVVGIAKKESSWGEHAPSKGGEDCYNYWGYKGSGERGTGMGYACFSTREEAVTTIANRLGQIVEKRQTSNPSSLVTTWKCGSSCATHSKQSVAKWVSDVSLYYNKVLAFNK